MSKPLTDKQERFCEEYMVDFNATQAAVRAGYSQKTAQKIGSENLSKPLIQEEIQKSMQQKKEEAGLTAKKVLDEIASIAFNDNTALLEEAMKEEDDEIRKAMITEILRGTKTVDRLKALDMLGKHIGIYEADNEQSKQGPITALEVKYV